METYVISGDLAIKFRKWILASEMKVVRDVKDLPRHKVTIAKIKEAVAKMYLNDVSSLDEDNRRPAVSTPRHVAFYLCRKYTDHSLPEIARNFGGKHHTTVLHGIAKVTYMIESDPKLASEIAELERELTA